MFNTPTDCYNYIIENDLEMPVLGAMMNHVGGYSIAEIADGRCITGMVKSHFHHQVIR